MKPQFPFRLSSSYASFHTNSDFLKSQATATKLKEAIFHYVQMEFLQVLFDWKL